MPLIYRKLTNGDYTFGGNSNDFISGTLAVGQAIKTSLLLLAGEWWEDTSKGLPLFQNILGQPGSPDHIRATDMLVQEVILKTQGVTQITAFQSSYQNRKYSITSCKVKSQYGDVILEEVTF